MQNLNTVLRAIPAPDADAGRGEVEAAATAALEQCGYHPKIAIVMLLCGCTAEEAEKRLTEKDGYIARVVG